MATTIVPFRLTSGQDTSRRAMLGRLATGATALALPATALAAEPDPHPAWLAEWQRLVDWCNSTGPGDRDLQDCPEWHRSMELEDLIASTPARTLAGAVCQLRLTHYYAGAAFPDDPADVAAANALVTLERLAGGQAHV